MERRPGERRLGPAWWALILLLTIGAFFAVTSSFFAGAFKSSVPVTLTSDRAGLVMEPGAKVKMSGVVVGKVGQIKSQPRQTTLQLEIEPDQIRYIPANVHARITANTAFGAKYVELVYPPEPSPQRLSPGAVLVSQNVATEVNTVFQNLVDVLDMIDPAKLNAVLSALAEGLRGQGERIGAAITDANQVLLALNSRAETMRADWQALGALSNIYDTAAQDILTVLSAASTTSKTVTSRAHELDALLLNVSGFAQSGTELLGANQSNLVELIKTAKPTTDLLLKYSPEYTCLLQGSTWLLENGAYANFGGNGRAAVFDIALLLGNDPYRYPDHLPIVGAKGGPGGKPGCGSLPDATKNFPVRALISNTGWGRGLDLRPNPGIGFPGWANYFPVTRAVPEPPVIRNTTGGPAPGPLPAHPGGAPYGADLYADDGTPLWPGLPPAPPRSDQPPPDPNNPPPGAEPAAP